MLSLRGTSYNNNMAAFRETYSELHELRSLAPSVKMIALTATATASTRKIGTVGAHVTTAKKVKI